MFGLGLWVVGCLLRVMGYGLRVVGYGLPVTGCGLLVACYGLWVVCGEAGCTIFNKLTNNLNTQQSNQLTN